MVEISNRRRVQAGEFKGTKLRDGGKEGHRDRLLLGTGRNRDEY